MDKRDLLETAREAVELGRRRGADGVEAYLSESDVTTVRVHGQEIELYTRAQTGGLGVRVFVGEKMGYAFATDRSTGGVARVVKDALANAGVAQPDVFNGLPGRPASERDLKAELDILFPGFDNIGADEKQQFALSLEEHALKFDRRVQGTEHVSYSDEKRQVALANSSGFAGQFTRTGSYCLISVLAGDKGETQAGYSFGLGRHLGELDARQVGEEAAQLAVWQLGAKPVRPRRATVVLDPVVAAQVLATLAAALTADAAQKGRSFLAGKVGRSVATSGLTVVDDGRLKGGLGSQPFDDEAVATRTTPVIEQGVLKTFLYDGYTARKDRRESTGNAGRAGFKSPPAPAPTNLFVKPGARGKDEIIGSVSSGLYVLSVAGLHAGVNTVTGQFSVGASGLWIEQGKRTFPVREVTIASTLPEILVRMGEVGRDLRFMPFGGSIGAPTLLVEDMTISGR